MKIEYELTRQDYIEFNLFHISYSKSVKKVLLIERYAVPGAFLFMPFIVKVYSIIPLWYWFVCFTTVAIMWIVLFPKSVKKSIAKRVTKMLDEGKNAGLLGRRSLIISDEGIVEKSESIESKTNWNAVENIAVTTDYIFIYIAAVMAYIVPTRVFESNQDKEAFVDFIKKNMNSSK